MILYLITYDVSTSTDGGAKRLRKVARECLDYGQRVQNSVFECRMTYAQYVALKAKLTKIIDLDKDSIRFYKLGKNGDSHVEYIGRLTAFDVEDVMII